MLKMAVEVNDFEPLLLIKQEICLASAREFLGHVLVEILRMAYMRNVHVFTNEEFASGVRAKFHVLFPVRFFQNKWVGR